MPALIRERPFSEEGEEMEAKPVFMSLHPLRAPGALCENFIFLDELGGRIAKGFLLRLQLTIYLFAAQTKVQVFGKILGLSEAVFLRTDAEVLAVKASGALPNSARRVNRAVLCLLISCELSCFSAPLNKIVGISPFVHKLCTRFWG